MKPAIDTSAAAHADIKPKAPSIRARVFELISAQNGVGISRTQIVGLLGLNEITVGSRITELLQAGKIRRKGETVASKSGKQEHLYVLGDGKPVAVANKADLTPKQYAQVLKEAGITANRVKYNVSWSDTTQGFEFWRQVWAQLSEVKA